MFSFIFFLKFLVCFIIDIYVLPTNIPLQWHFNVIFKRKSITEHIEFELALN